MVLLDLSGDVVGDGLKADGDKLDDDGRSNAEPARQNEDEPEERVIKHPDIGANKGWREYAKGNGPPDGVEEEPQHGAKEQGCNNRLGEVLDLNGKL